MIGGGGPPGAGIGPNRRFFWVASYPRSGNTLVRIALNRILQGPERQVALDEDFPEYDHRNAFPTNGVAFSGRGGPVVFLKTHWCEPPETVPSIGGIYLVRHPIDVFLSGMNYLFLEHQKYEVFRLFFGENGPQPVEQLAQTGKLEHYLDRFVAEQGLWPFRLHSGTWVQNVLGWAGAPQPTMMIVRYEDLVQDLAGTISQILERAGIAVAEERLDRGIDQALAGTQPNGGFFWRGSIDTKSEFFTPARIRQVENALRPLVGSRFF
jgi:hypothetical protein